jgi:hypothetical protein
MRRDVAKFGGRYSSRRPTSRPYGPFKDFEGDIWKLKGMTELAGAYSYLVGLHLVRAIVGARIVCLDTPAPAFDDPVWGASSERSEIILKEGGIAIRIVDVAADPPV